MKLLFLLFTLFSPLFRPKGKHVVFHFACSSFWLNIVLNIPNLLLLLLLLYCVSLFFHQHGGTKRTNF